MECSAWLSTSAGLLEDSNYLLSELGYCYLLVRILNFVSFLVRTEPGDRSIANSVAGFQVTDVEIQPAEYSVALVTVTCPMFKSSQNMLIGK